MNRTYDDEHQSRFQLSDRTLGNVEAGHLDDRSLRGLGGRPGPTAGLGYQRVNGGVSAARR